MLSPSPPGSLRPILLSFPGEDWFQSSQSSPDLIVSRSSMVMRRFASVMFAIWGYSCVKNGSTG
jgi:hypothetical protein